MDKGDGGPGSGPHKLRLACDPDQLTPFVEWFQGPPGVLHQRPALPVKAPGYFQERGFL